MARSSLENKEYWELRSKDLFDSQDKKNKKFEKKLRKEYNRIGESINNEIATYYAKYGKDDVIEYRKMVLKLSKQERDLLYKDYDSFALRNPQYKKLMPVRESIYKLNRLEGMELSIRKHMVELGAFEEQGYEKLLKEAYESGYLSTMTGLDNTRSFFDVDRKVMEQALNDKWTSGKNYSDNLWENKEKLVRTINNDLRDAMIRGDNYQKTARTLRDRFEKKGMYESMRLIHTESSFILNQANKQAFMDAGIKRYEFTAVMDSRTSEACSGLDGQQFDFKDAQVGTNYGPMHPWCRSTSIPIEN